MAVVVGDLRSMASHEDSILQEAECSNQDKQMAAEKNPWVEAATLAMGGSKVQEDEEKSGDEMEVVVEDLHRIDSLLQEHR